MLPKRSGKRLKKAHDIPAQNTTVAQCPAIPHVPRRLPTAARGRRKQQGAVNVATDAQGRAGL